MSALGDWLRKEAEAVDQTPDAKSVLVVKSGDYQFSFAAQGEGQATFAALCLAAKQGAENGGGLHDPELAGKIQDILER